MLAITMLSACYAERREHGIRIHSLNGLSLACDRTIRRCDIPVPGGKGSAGISS